MQGKQLGLMVLLPALLLGAGGFYAAHGEDLTDSLESGGHDWVAGVEPEAAMMPQEAYPAVPYVPEHEGDHDYPQEHRHESPDHSISFAVPEGWDLEEEPDGAGINPAFVMTGPQSGIVPPSIAIGVVDNPGMSFDQLIAEIHADPAMVGADPGLEISYGEMGAVNGMHTYEIVGWQGLPEEMLVVRSTMFYGPEQSHVLTYVNGHDAFDADHYAFDVVLASVVIDQGGDAPGPIERPTDNRQGNPQDGAMCYEDGYDAGYGKGHDEGYTVGHEDGYDLGYERGYDAGYGKGFQEGFNTKISK